MSRNEGNTFLALLTGVAIGGVIGILFAPDKGKKTREKIKNNFDDAKKNIQNIDLPIKDLKNKILKTKKSIEDNYDDLLSNMSNKTEDIIAFLENKLSDLKDGKGIKIK